MFRFTNLWKVVAFVGATITIIGSGLKLFSFIPGLPYQTVWEPAQFWGDVLPLVFGPFFLGQAAAFYLGINRGPLPGTLRLIDKIIAKIQPGESKFGWLKVFLTGVVIASLGWWIMGRYLYFPGTILSVMSAWKGEWASLIWQLPMLIVGITGSAYATGLYANVFYRIAEEFDPEGETVEGATTDATA